MKDYNLSSFDFPYPAELIARFPLKKRDEARMIVVNREERSVRHRHVYDLPEYFSPDDLLILNNTKVIPARIYGKREKSGGRVEILLVREASKSEIPPEKSRDKLSFWKAMINMNRKVRDDLAINISNDLKAKVLVSNFEMSAMTPMHLLEFNCPPDIFLKTIEGTGTTPLPPYIKRKTIPEDRETYQTVYARKPGAVAAPTAGLHFTEELLSRIKGNGTKIINLTLHVGPGTFVPVEEDNIRDHVMHSEEYSITDENFKILKNHIDEKKKVTAAGTTTVRTLETVMQEGTLSGDSSLFIYPGFEFRATGRLLTNFHFPRSTLFMLVSAFAGTDFMKECYMEAFKERYRLFSYGDAMLIL